MICEYCNEDRKYLIVKEDGFKTIKDNVNYVTKVFTSPLIVCLSCFVFDVTDGELEIYE